MKLTKEKNNNGNTISLTWLALMASTSWNLIIYIYYLYAYTDGNLYQPTFEICINQFVALGSIFPMEATKKEAHFEDFLPIIAEKLGGEGLIRELCNGFELLMDADKGLITFESLKSNSALLGLQDLRDQQLQNMLREGDLDGDGALNQMEFCVLMFRLSPDLMDGAERLLDEALLQDLNHN